MQLDFIGNIYNNSFIQGDLFDTPVARKTFTKNVEEFFHSVNPKEIQEHYNYWSKITPEEPEQKFQRYLFAFLSVHTTWESNCKAYNLLKDFNQWKDDEVLLHKKLVQSRVGMQNNRTKYLNKFIKEFAENESVKVVNGMYGPYIQIGKRNVKIPKGTEPADLTLEECLALGDAAPAPKKARKK